MHMKQQVNLSCPARASRSRCTPITSLHQVSKGTVYYVKSLVCVPAARDARRPSCLLAPGRGARRLTIIPRPNLEFDRSHFFTGYRSTSTIERSLLGGQGQGLVFCVRI